MDMLCASYLYIWLDHIHNVQHVLVGICACMYVASFPSPTLREEGLVHTVCPCAWDPEKCGVVDIIVYITILLCPQ